MVNINSKSSKFVYYIFKWKIITKVKWYGKIIVDQETFYCEL
jgi:hypothetical protein